jgi:hypothetical protein
MCKVKNDAGSLLLGVVTVMLFPFILLWQALTMDRKEYNRLVSYHQKCEHYAMAMVWVCGVVWGIASVYASTIAGVLFH